MAERIARLYGPATVSADTSSPTSLFTVPTGKIYVARGVHIVSYPSNGAAGTATPSVLIGKTDLASGNIAAGFSSSSPGGGGYIVSSEGISIPFTEGEVAVASSTNLPRPTTSNATSSGHYVLSGGLFFAESTTDSTTLAVTATPVLPSAYAPANVYFLICNAKASSADAVSSITDTHSPRVLNASSIASVVVGTTTSVRASIWGGYLPGVDANSGTVTVTWGGTWTAAAWGALAVNPSALFQGAPSTSNVVLQTATNSGTTETTWGVTMTPTAGAKSFQLLVACQQGGTSTTFSNLPTGAIQLDVISQGTPNFTGGAWIIPESQTDPSVTIAVAGSNWAMACAEIAYAGYPTHLTLSGVIQEP